MKFLAAIAVALLSASPTLAGERRLQPCQYNSGKWIQVRSIDNGSTFTLEWDDGPRMSYTWRGSNLDHWNVTDTKGGRWHYTDHRNQGGFTLMNINNGNQIKCLGVKR
ncbi:hypothetical protein PMIT1313_00066 [Prochlorococcus marinus str. MIT 1313]|uniref:hypothetical protein n=1 Tax=Prochlorococcus TaxID=1218 RepID=UPI0007B39336|nr:hypothetical protein [Prochlorococcus marinus]KZR72710.1 hypothetical protein PMIT1313_00066 [Prochlorococcus marinus str. MIT 1313]